MKFKLILLVVFYCLAQFQCNKPAQEKMQDAIPPQNQIEEAVIEAEAVSVPIADKPISGAQKNFETYCTSCHGNEVNAFVDRKWKHGSTRADLVRSINEGIIKAGMPAYDTTFTDTEVDELADYILNGIANRKSYDVQEEETPKYYSTELLSLQIDTVVNEAGIPWGIKVGQDGTIYYTLKSGKFKYKKPNAKAVDVKNVPQVVEDVQGGLMDVALHPNFQSNQLLYLSYSKPMGEGKTTTAIVRARLEGDRLVEVEEVFIAEPAVDRAYHYGSRMIFDNAGYLFVTVGDRAHRDKHPQFFSNSCGKVHRINDDGTIPTDNPYFKNVNAIKSIWSYGHRNPQGLIYDSENDRIWENEHGPRGGDELNLIRPATNYGWPTISYGINYNGTTFTDKTETYGMEQPANYWTPSIAPSGMALVTGDRYGKWKGNILSGSLRFKYVSRIVVDGEKVIHEERILNGIGRVRAIEMGLDGYLYVGVENPGRILKVSVGADQ